MEIDKGHTFPEHTVIVQRFKRVHGQNNIETREVPLDKLPRRYLKDPKVAEAITAIKERPADSPVKLVIIERRRKPFMILPMEWRHHDLKL